jgi:hypothetical protein
VPCGCNDGGMSECYGERGLRMTVDTVKCHVSFDDQAVIPDSV